MPLLELIEQNADAIVSEWARRRELAAGPSGLGSPTDPDRAAAPLLQCIARQMGGASPATEAQVRGALFEQAARFAAGRLAANSPLNALINDFCALRSVITARWCTDDPSGAVGREELRELIAFDETLDLALAEASRAYIARIEDARELFNGVLAHDLRTPLSAILASAELLMLDESLDSMQMATAARIRVSGTRMGKLIEDMLDFARTRLLSTLPITLSPDDLGQIIREVAAELGTFHPDVQIRWTATGDLSLLCDAGRIEQVISNLLSNAVDHGQPGGPVAIHAASHGDALAIRVHNFGDPIPQEELQVIFHPLIRAVMQERAGTGLRKGLGLGLYIARQIVEAHGGTISAASTQRDGTTFFIRLPRRLGLGPESTSEARAFTNVR